MTDRRRILHFIDSGGIYGAENVLLNLSLQMRRSGDFEPLVGCIVSATDERSALYDRARELGIEARQIVIRNAAAPADLIRAARNLQDRGVDLIHSHGYKPSVFGAAIRRLSGIEVMATCHLWYQGRQRPLKMRMMIRLELLLYRRFRSVVGVSESIRATLLESGVPDRVLTVIRNGVDGGEQLGAGRAEELRAEIGLRPGERLVINTGRLTKQKAQASIVEAACILADGRAPIRFLIVGDGELADDLRDRIRAAGLEETVLLLGFRDDVRDLLRIADLYVLPSYDEGMPMALLEAAAEGLPIVASPVGDVPRVVQDGESGLLVEPGDADQLAATISRLLEDPALAERCAARARAVVERDYSSAAMYRNYEPIYRRLTGSGS